MRATAPALAAIVTAWNDETPPGTDVIIVEDDGTRIHTKTSSLAELLGGHTPVIWLDGISGCYSLDRVIKQGMEGGQ